MNNIDVNTINIIKEHARNIRKLILDMGKHASGHAAHIGGALSIADIMATLYFGIMNVKNVGMDEDARDRLILSKGHASLVLYASLIEAGIMPEKLKYTFEDDYSDLLGHPVKNKKLGIEFTNGSLGMGLSLGIGVAIACKRKELINHIYVIVGDGECNEGSVWEAIMSAPKFKLDNLTLIIDNNNFQLSGANDEIMPLGSIKDKLQSFDWNTIECNGHDVNELIKSFSSVVVNKPRAIIANTIKGKGLRIAENNNLWHHAVVTQKVYEEGIKELGFE